MELAFCVILARLVVRFLKCKVYLFRLLRRICGYKTGAEEKQSLAFEFIDFPSLKKRGQRRFYKYQGVPY